MVGSTKTLSSSDDGYLRKIRKPLVEKRRRERMNRSIDQLKMLIADSIGNVTSTKLDKADILDLTVNHLQRLKNHQASVSMATEASSYSSGFKECAKETISYLSSTRVITPESLGHLSNHLHSVHDKKTDILSVEPEAVTSRASSPVIQTSPPQYCSTPVQGLHGLLNTSTYSVTDSFSDSSVYNDIQMYGPACSVIDVSQISRCRVSSQSRGLVSSQSISLSDTYSSASQLSASGISSTSEIVLTTDSDSGYSEASGIVLNDISNEGKPWRPW